MYFKFDIKILNEPNGVIVVCTISLLSFYLKIIL